ELRDAACPAHVALDELHLTRFLQRAGEAKADVAAAGEHDPADPRVLLAQLADDTPDVIAGCKEEDFVTLFDDGRALGGDAAAAPVDSNDARLHPLQVFRQLAQAMTNQKPAADGAHPDQSHLAC